ncbi:hypothetical protein BDA96_02G109100 [Sorghum bicolor]|uniref:Water stress and hypersensitive response domain-containing protein n=1 Tax=Sorghum bicolor TaxID=4558 RepID=A0A921RMT0_SORBI|nr:hypothetical protein BDA96_02G109100 [Sorghum bicolor]
MFSTRRQHGFLAPSTNSCVPSSSTTSILLACASPSNHLRRHIGDPSMSSSDSPKVTERKVDNDGHDDDDKGGFFDKVKDFIQDVGEKIEEAVGFGKPTADVTGIHIPHVSLEKIELIVDVLIANPNPVPIPLVDIEYLIESEERKLVSGTIPDAGTIHAHGSETVKIPFLLIYDDIRSTYKEIEPGSIIPYKVRVVLHIDIPVIGRISIPLEKNGEIPVPYKPDVSIDKIKFEQFSFEESTAILHLNWTTKMPLTWD